MHSRSTIVQLIFLIVAAFSLSVCLAGNDSSLLFKPEVKSLALFKNGLGFFVREGEAVLKNGWAETELVPGASLGSIWITPLDKDTALDSVISFKDETHTTVTATDIMELLKINTGKRVIIKYGDETIDGIIKSAASLIIIETKAGTVVLNVSSISEAKFPDSFFSDITRNTEIKKIKFKMISNKDKVRLGVSYLQKGISWIPDYRVNLEDQTYARISMNATMINDIEDIRDADVYFVVGYPHFAYSEMLSPLSLQQSLAEFIASLTSGSITPRTFDNFSNIMTQSISYGNERTRADVFGYSSESAAGLPGENNEDLFFYNKKGVTLQKGERGYYNIFSDTVQYKHVYEWEIPDLIHIDYYGRTLSRDTKEEREQVWHSIKLTNSTDYPWTTAPAFTVNGWKPLGQDKLSYTPKGASTHLKLTIATDIKTDRNENEVSRTQVKVSGDDYDLITIRGEISMKNFKSQDITLEIKKLIVGEVLSTTYNGKAVKTVQGLTSVNPNSIITWTIPVKANENIIVNYRYQIYKYR
jgi:hypothetical protein